MLSDDDVIWLEFDSISLVRIFLVKMVGLFSYNSL